MSDWQALVVYSYLVIAALTYVGSDGPRFGRLVLAVLWPMILLSFATTSLLSFVLLYSNEWLTFNPARRAFRFVFRRGRKGRRDRRLLTARGESSVGVAS